VYDRAKTRFARLRTQLDRTLREQGTGRSPVPSQQQYDKAVGLLAKMKQRAQQLASLRRRLRAVRVGDLFVGPADDLRGLNRADRVPHHGVMSAWMRENYARYAAGTAPAVLLDTRDHYKTLGVFNKWRRRAEVPVADGGVAWARISERQARDLAEAQFDAANVPAAARREYWGQFATYKALLGPRIRR
jgi:hypothetical protein